MCGTELKAQSYGAPLGMVFPKEGPCQAWAAPRPTCPEAGSTVWAAASSHNASSALVSVHAMLLLLLREVALRGWDNICDVPAAD